MRGTVKTYTPVLNMRLGPTCLDPYNAMYDIVNDMVLRSKMKVSNEELNKTIKLLVQGMKMERLQEGTYPILQNYAIIVEFFDKDSYTNMPEFDGY